MYEKRNRYLEDKAMRRRDMRSGRDYRSRAGNGYLNDAEVQYQMGMRDGRNPYGSRGGYVVSDRSNGNDYAMDYRNDYAERNRRYDYRYDNESRNRDFNRYPEQYGEHARPYMDYEMRNRDYRYDYRMDYDDMEKEYHEDLKKWIEKLQKMDTRIKVGKDQVIRQAKNMNVRFNDFTEEEFYATYLMIISDFPTISNDYNVYLSMAKDWLMDKDAKLQGSDKLCTYMYEIVMGKSKEEDDD